MPEDLPMPEKSLKQLEKENTNRRFLNILLQLTNHNVLSKQSKYYKLITKLFHFC